MSLVPKSAPNTSKPQKYQIEQVSVYIAETLQTALKRTETLTYIRSVSLLKFQLLAEYNNHKFPTSHTPPYSQKDNSMQNPYALMDRPQIRSETLDKIRQAIMTDQRPQSLEERIEALSDTEKAQLMRSIKMDQLSMQIQRAIDPYIV